MASALVIVFCIAAVALAAWWAHQLRKRANAKPMGRLTSVGEGRSD